MTSTTVPWFGTEETYPAVSMRLAWVRDAGLENPWGLDQCLCVVECLPPSDSKKPAVSTLINRLLTPSETASDAGYIPLYQSYLHGHRGS